MCATVSPSIIEFVIFSKMWNLISLFWWGGSEEKETCWENRSTRFSNCANVERKNGRQFSGFIYKRWYIKLNDNRIKLTSVVSTIQFEPRCIHECLVYFRIESLVTKEVSRVRVPFFHIEKIPYLQVRWIGRNQESRPNQCVVFGNFLFFLFIQF